MNETKKLIDEALTTLSTLFEKVGDKDVVDSLKLTAAKLNEANSQSEKQEDEYKSLLKDYASSLKRQTFKEGKTDEETTPKTFEDVINDVIKERKKD